MRKSILSKISGYSSILNSASPDQNLQILRISLKKQLDRKQKLQRLMQKYQQITSQQKCHIKSIKSSIIQLKDLQSNSKTRFYLNPIIYVDNNLSKQTREYLCMLLNTFYSKYEENYQCESKTKVLNKEMNQLLEMISGNQGNLLKIQKETIGVQVQLEGELLGYKTRLKDETARQKELEDQNKRVAGICGQFEEKYHAQLQKVIKLRSKCQAIEAKIQELKSQVAEGELVKKGKEEMMANQIAYQEKFKIQLGNLDDDTTQEEQKGRQLKVKIRQKKLKVQEAKRKYQKLCRVADSVMGKENQCNTTCPNDHNKQNKPNNNHKSLLNIKKFTDAITQTLNSSYSMVHTDSNVPAFMMNSTAKSKDLLDHQVQMRIVEMKRQQQTPNTFGCDGIRKARVSVK